MVTRFRGEFSFLSNFHPSPIRLGGVVYPTAEHAFQAAKTLDRAERARIAAVASPGEAKRLGRKVTLRPNWDGLRIEVMRAILDQKFRVHKELGAKLIATGDAPLLEGNTWGDRFWGVTWDAAKKRWVGKNHLGALLMGVRTRLILKSDSR